MLYTIFHEKQMQQPLTFNNINGVYRGKLSVKEMLI